MPLSTGSLTKPGIVAVGITNALPASGGFEEAAYTIEGEPAANWKLKVRHVRDHLRRLFPRHAASRCSMAATSPQMIAPTHPLV